MSGCILILSIFIHELITDVQLMSPLFSIKISYANHMQKSVRHPYDWKTLFSCVEKLLLLNDVIYDHQQKCTPVDTSSIPGAQSNSEIGKAIREMINISCQSRKTCSYKYKIQNNTYMNSCLLGKSLACPRFVNVDWGLVYILRTLLDTWSTL